MSRYCRATLNYGTATDVQSREVEILDGRSLDGLSWQENGFELIRHASKVEDWSAVENDWLHYDEIGELTRRLTGCDAVLYLCPAPSRSPHYTVSVRLRRPR